jgi:hypothetical protein
MRFPKPARRIRKSPKPLRRSKPIAKRSRPRGRSKSPLAQAKQEAWRLLSRIVRERNGGRCEYREYYGWSPEEGNLWRCCSAPSTEAAHIMNKKVYPALYYHPLNLLALCHQHHVDLGDAKLGKPSRMESFVVYSYGAELFATLCELAIERRKFDRGMLPALRAQAAELGIK